MRLGTMLKDVSGSLLRRPFTQPYPYQRTPVPDRLRGRLNWEAEKCTGCGLCALDCPSGAVEIIALDKKARRFILRYSMDACTFCAQCVYSCRQQALHMSSQEWELAALDRDSFGMIFGAEDDIREWMESNSAE